jgi:uncharacterized protein (TIGR03437 family)
VFFIGSNPYVVDTGNARILGYDPYAQWPGESAAFSPAAKVAIGQSGFQSGLSNQGLPRPNASTLASPISAVFDGADLLVADAGNNRVLAFPQSGGVFTAATRVLGQLDFQYNSTNLIVGRELGFSGNTGSCSVNGALPFVFGGSVAIDSAASPPHLYISDPLNNRVLAYNDYRRVNAGAGADLVIGQPDLMTALVNYPNNSATQANAQGLWSPEGLAVDSNGNLYVADACNARVLRFPAPFGQTPGVMPSADLAIGQTSLIGQPIKDASQQTLKSAYGLAFTGAGDLVVSDTLANRILYFRKTASGDFETGQAASNVFGQPDFSSSLASVFSAPHLIATDAGDQLYVADTGNSRIAALPPVPTAGYNPPILFSIPQLTNPYGVFVNPTTGEIWAVNTGGNRLLRYANSAAILTNAPANATVGAFGPVAMTLDPFGNPIVAESATNRVSFYYPAIDYTTSAGGVPNRLSGNTANFFGRFAPGMLATVFSFPASPFGTQTASSSTQATALGDVQVTVGGMAAPLTMVSPGQINFQMPQTTPVNGYREIEVSQVSTGQVFASWLFRIDAESPGLFTVDGSGAGQVAAVNQDGSLNNDAHPAKAGSIVTLYATGQGVIQGMPADGAVAQAILSTSETPQVFINSAYVAPGDVMYSGLAPGFTGLWQINVKVPSNVPPGDVIVFIAYNGINSILDPNGIRRLTTIATTQ